MPASYVVWQMSRRATWNCNVRVMYLTKCPVTFPVRGCSHQSPSVRLFRALRQFLLRHHLRRGRPPAPHCRRSRHFGCWVKECERPPPGAGTCCPRADSVSVLSSSFGERSLLSSAQHNILDSEIERFKCVWKREHGFGEFLRLHE